MSATRFEVEGKWPITQPEHRRIGGQLASLGFEFGGKSEQEDHFLPVQNPKDNRRIRFETTGDETTIDYTLKKKVNVGGVDTRQEDERMLGVDEAGEMLAQARRENGDRPLPSFSKTRTSHTGNFREYPVTVCLDAVVIQADTLFFLEVEIIVTEAAQVGPANAAVDEFAAMLLGGPRERETRSHKEMLFARLGLS